MTVPSGGSEKRNTTGGAFTHAKQGGTIINNNSTTVTNSVTGDGIITKAFELDDSQSANKADTCDNRPKALANGLVGAQAIAGSSFAYNASGPTLSDPTWVLSRVSTTLAGVANTKLQSMGSAPSQSIAQFHALFGAQTVTAFRAGRFTLTGTFANGTSDLGRHNWLNSAHTALSLPTPMAGIYPWGISAGANGNRRLLRLQANHWHVIISRILRGGRAPPPFFIGDQHGRIMGIDT